VWREATHALLSGATRLGFRQVGVPGGLHEVVAATDALWTAYRWRLAGRDFVIDETAPDERNTLQGELVRTARGLEGYLGVRTGKRMRLAMAEGLLTPRRGVEVQLLLDQFMDASSREDVNYLLDRYDGAVIEFCCYDLNVGVLPHRNTIIWEVRHY